MSEATATYCLKITPEQKQELKKMFLSADWESFGGGEYNITLYHEEHEDKLIEWCEEREIEATFV